MSKPKADQPSPQSFSCAAWILDCDVAAIRAVADVESGPEGAFLPTGEPVILYEPHIFDQLTHGRYRGRTAATLHGEPAVLSRPKWTPGTYGATSIQHTRLQAAVELDREAALMSCSWGLFQILGMNHQRAGYSTVQQMVTAAYRSADDHLKMFVMFIHQDQRLLDALDSHTWVDFARVYNGPRYADNRYDSRLALAYERISKEIVKDAANI